MEQPPNEMTIAKLEVLVMPNGEILCMGEAIGWIRKNHDGIGKKLSDFRSAITGQPVDELGEEI